VPKTKNIFTGPPDFIILLTYKGKQVNIIENVC
jgi:hypothetical protein